MSGNRQKRVYLIVFMLAIMMILQLNSAFAAEKRLALIPPILQNSRVEDSIVENTQIQLEQALHVPLNDILKRIDYVCDQDSESAFLRAYEAAKAAKADNKRVKLASILEPIALDLNADLVILPVIKNSFQEEYYSIHREPGETMLISQAHLELYIYTRADNSIRVYTADDSYRGSYSLSGQLSLLIRNCTAKVIHQSQLYGIVKG